MTADTGSQTGQWELGRGLGLDRRREHPPHPASSRAGCKLGVDLDELREEGLGPDEGQARGRVVGGGRAISGSGRGPEGSGLGKSF